MLLWCRKTLSGTDMVLDPSSHTHPSCCSWLIHRGRAQALEFCVPTENLAVANQIFATGAAKDSYVAWRGHYPESIPQSPYHTFPRYRLKHDGPLFDFYLVPSDDWRFECVPDNFEYSAQKHLPYPKLHVFAQSLLERQDFHSLEELVDGMDLTEEWGESNLKFEDLGEEYRRWVAGKNEKIRAALPQELKEEALELGTEIYEIDEAPPAFKDIFVRLVKTKEGRIGLEAPLGLNATKYRTKKSADPRTRIRFNV